jgi:carbamoyl-phosphate synthase/aspartate carbamoyltransferase/dihydroorotase/carbamoyl-phosphate synthase/aspartate carbamoyltransferase
MEKGLEPPYHLNKVVHDEKDGTGLTGADILSVSQFDIEKLEYIFSRAREMREVVKRIGGTDLLKGRVLACIFYEPSTRTSASFIAAMERLGGGVIPITQGVQFSSVSKGESLADTIRVLEQYADVIVLRHPEIGSAQLAADYASVPVINAGDGPGEHPTQALLDLFTIREELGQVDGLKIAMVGDLRYGRTVHSLTKLLLQYDVSLRFVSPESLRLPLNIMNQVIDAGKPVRETHDVADVIENANVLYVTRVQKERFSDESQYEEVKDFYKITPELMEKAQRENDRDAPLAPCRRNSLCRRQGSPGRLFPPGTKWDVYSHGFVGGRFGQSLKVLV